MVKQVNTSVICINLSHDTKFAYLLYFVCFVTVRMPLFHLHWRSQFSNAWKTKLKLTNNNKKWRQTYKSIFMCLLFGTLDFVRPGLRYFLFAVVCRLLKYLMSTNFPLKPIQRSIQLPLFAYSSCNKVRKPWLLDRRERCDFTELRCDATTTRTNKNKTATPNQLQLLYSFGYFASCLGVALLCLFYFYSTECLYPMQSLIITEAQT